MTREVAKRRRVTPRQVLGVASLGAVLAFVDATIVNVAFPDIREDFGEASLSGISWVLNAYPGSRRRSPERCCWAAWTRPKRRALTRTW